MTSNVLRGDYAGSAECRLCHPDIYKRWITSPMHRMTRRADSAQIRAPFDGATFRIGGDSITMEERDGSKLMHLVSARDGDRLFRITKVIGGRYREDFAGVDVTGATDPGTVRSHGSEWVMPVSYVFSTQSWRYKGYSVQIPERPGLRAGPVWSKTCLGCHNTLPYLLTIYDDLLGPRREPYQGSVSDDLLPPSRLWSFKVEDAAGLDSALADEITFLGGERSGDRVPLNGLLLDALRTTRRRLRTPQLIEVGIGCESCHGGSREHADDPSVMPTFEVRSPLISRGPSAGVATHAAWLNRTCAHCHTVLFSGYPFTWEGGRRSDPVPGGSTVNSGEARNFLLGGCSSEMTCATCHDPHTEDPRARLREMGTVAGNTICLRCHDQLRSAAALRDHTHHDPGGAGSACIACHMPRKNVGLDYELSRYHRIGSPTDDNRVLRDRPLECALCHVDASVEMVVGQMEHWWGRRYDRQALRRLYGDDLSVNVLDSTLARGKPHEQSAAIGALGEHRIASAVPRLVPQLAHHYPIVRFLTKHAIETITGESLPIDPNRPAVEIEEAAARWLARWQATHPARHVVTPARAW